MFDDDKENEMARRFDLWMLEIQVGQLTSKPSRIHISQVMKTAPGSCFCWQYPSGLCTGRNYQEKYKNLNFGRK